MNVSRPDPLHFRHGADHKFDFVSRPVPAHQRHLRVPIVWIFPVPPHTGQVCVIAVIYTYVYVCSYVYFMVFDQFHHTSHMELS